MTHLVEEFIEMGDSDMAQTNLEWLSSVGILSAKEFHDAVDRRVKYQEALQNKLLAQQQKHLSVAAGKDV